MLRMYEPFLHNLRKAEWYHPGDSLLLACSGGVDSMVMLRLFREAAREDGVLLTVGHVNHQLRPESTADEEFLRRYCEEHELSVLIERVDMAGERDHTGESMEMAARRLRYHHLEEMRKTAGASLICTAHTKSDQAETVLMRVLKGAGLTGLQGIRRQRGCIVRPLLDFSREEIVRFAKDRQVPFREDVSNFDVSIQRNWIRHQLLPQIREQMNPNIIDTLVRVSQVQREVEEYLSYIGEDAYANTIVERASGKIILDISALRRYFTAVQKIIIFKCLSDLGFSEHSLKFSRMQQVLGILTGGASGSELRLFDELKVFKDRTQALFTTEPIDQRFRERFQPNSTCRVRDFTFISSIDSTVTRDRLLSSNEMRAYFDWDKIGGFELYWRNWDEGDVLRLPDGGTKKVSDVWIDNKVPVWEKHRIPLLAGREEVLWIPGLKRSGRGWVTSETKKVLKITATRQS